MCRWKKHVWKHLFAKSILMKIRNISNKYIETLVSLRRTALTIDPCSIGWYDDVPRTKNGERHRRRTNPTHPNPTRPNPLKLSPTQSTIRSHGLKKTMPWIEKLIVTMSKTKTNPRGEKLVSRRRRKTNGLGKLAVSSYGVAQRVYIYISHTFLSLSLSLYIYIYI